MANEEMDYAADQAARELESLDKSAVKAVAEWWERWFRTAGHKRLGWKLMNYGKRI